MCKLHAEIEREWLQWLGRGEAQEARMPWYALALVSLADWLIDTGLRLKKNYLSHGQATSAAR